MPAQVFDSWPDLEDLLCVLFATGGVQTGTVTPADLQQRMPFLRIGRTGGGNDLFTDLPRIMVESFAPTRALARGKAEQVRQALLATPVFLDGTCIDFSTVLSGPLEMPWDDTKIRRFVASYALSLRRSG